MRHFIYNILILIFTVAQVYSLDKSLLGQSILYGLSSLSENINRDTTCLNELHELYEGINLKRFWALKVLDASGQPRSGFLWGNNLWLGSHFQCTDVSNRKPMEVNSLKVKHPDPTPFDFPPYPINFVMAYMKHNNTQQLHTQMPLESTIQLGLCLPESCTVDELGSLIRTYLNKRYLNVQQFYNLDIEVQEVKILKLDSWLFLPKTLITLSICGVTLLLVAIGTIYDVKFTQPYLKAKRNESLEDNPKNNTSHVIGIKRNAKEELSANGNETSVVKKDGPRFGIFGEIIQCFSIYSNTKALVKTKISTESVKSIHGFRLFSLLWVICLHTIFYQIDYLENVATGFRLSEPIFVQTLSNGSYCVDSFLFLSGFLISYTFYKSKKHLLSSKKAVNIKAKIMELLTMFTHRYLRLTPPYVITILISDILFTYYRKTSAFNPSEQPDINCPNYWWRNLLYINNFYPRSEMCLSWSWYLSADTQFFFITSVLLILSTISIKVATSLLLFLIITCMTITGYSSYRIGYIPTMDEQFAQLDAIYDFPWNRVGPYLIGVITGYILVVKLDGKMKLKKSTLALMWIIFPMINLWILFTIYGRQISVEFSAVYMGISRTCWGFGLGWLLIACYTGNAGAINTFLSFRGWIPLSRLTYCSYLLNPLLISIIYLGTESSQSSSYASFTISIYGSAFLTFFLAYWYSVLFESPYILLTKILFSKLMKREKSNNNPA